MKKARKRIIEHLPGQKIKPEVKALENPQSWKTE